MDAVPSDFQELRRFLEDGEELNLTDEAIVPSCPPSDTLAGLFGVRPPLPSFLAKQTNPIFAFSLRDEDVEIDRKFLGFTQLYATEPEKPVLAESVSEYSSQVPRSSAKLRLFSQYHRSSGP